VVPVYTCYSLSLTNTLRAVTLTTPPPSSMSSESNSDGVNKGAIAGGVVGGVAGVALGALIWAIHWSHSRRSVRNMRIGSPIAIEGGMIETRH
jgi:hypothetical protein